MAGKNFEKMENVGSFHVFNFYKFNKIVLESKQNFPEQGLRGSHRVQTFLQDSKKRNLCFKSFVSSDQFEFRSIPSHF